jgi:hypothetical protein
MRDAALEPLALGPAVLGSEAEGTRVLRSNLELLEMRLLAVVEMVALEVTLLLAETEKELLGLIEFEDELVECGVECWKKIRVVVQCPSPQRLKKRAGFRWR